jgi:hypothetical protein
VRGQGALVCCTPDPTEGVQVRWIKSSALLLAASLTLGAGLAVVTAGPVAAKERPVTLHKGNNKITLTWVSRANGTAFLGTIGNVSIEGSSVQPNPNAADFDVTGQLEGKTNLKLTLALMAANARALTFRATGTIGDEALKGKVAIAIPASPTGNGSLSLSGTLGGKAISGNVPLPADTTNHVAGKIKVG